MRTAEAALALLLVVVAIEQPTVRIFWIIDMTLRRRSSALPPGNLCNSARQSQAYPSYSPYRKSITSHISDIHWPDHRTDPS